MKPPLSSNIPLQRIGLYMAALMIAWTLAVAPSIFFNLDQHRQVFLTEMHTQAKTIHIMEMGFRNWVIGHGGVYVPVDDDTPPSKYLKSLPERDVSTESGKQLTLLNSSYVMRQVNELIDQDNSQLNVHLTSLNPLNPVNKADSWEVTALKAFEGGEQEVSGIEEKADGKRYYRFMQPMITEASCLKCHAHQGYQVGDIRGGVSISIPVDELPNTGNLELVSHGGIWLLGIAAIFFGGRRQQQTLLSIEKSEAEVRLLTDSIAHAIYGQNLKGECTFANAACVSLLGYEQESELLGKHMQALIHYRHPDGSPYPESECPTHRSIHEGKTFHIDEEVLWRKDGSSFPAAYWSYPIKHGGKTIGAVTTFLDISEQKRVGEALRQSEKLLDTIVEHIPAMLFLKDAEELRFERFNRAGEKLLGYSRQQLLGKNNFDFFTPEQAEFFTAKDKSVLDSHEAVEVPEEVIRTADGQEKWLHTFKVGLYDEQDKPIHLLGISMDITERKLIDISLEHANRTLQTLSTVNRELVHATEEMSLLQAICSAIVEQKNYRMAWVGYVQQDAKKSIKQMVSAGDDHDILASVQPSWADDEKNGMGPSGKAVRERRTQLVNDLAKETLYPEWKEELIRQGCVSSIALPLKNQEKVFGILHVYADEVNAFTPQEIDLLEEMAADLAFGVSSLRIRLERDKAMAQNEQHLELMHDSLVGTVDAIARAVEVRDPYTAGHQRRVASLACAIAKRMGLDDDRIEGIRMGATIHDIGKIQVPAEILTKPTKLTKIEYMMIQNHAQVGYDILKDIRFPWPVADIAHQHHERMDGSGYPQGLKGEEICLEARIVAVADVVEAMASHRPYKQALGIDVALAEIKKNQGNLYDAVVADACLKVFAEDNFNFDLD